VSANTLRLYRINLATPPTAFRNGKTLARISHEASAGLERYTGKALKTNADSMETPCFEGWVNKRVRAGNLIYRLQRAIFSNIWIIEKAGIQATI